MLELYIGKCRRFFAYQRNSGCFFPGTGPEYSPGTIRITLLITRKPGNPVAGPAACGTIGSTQRWKQTLPPQFPSILATKKKALKLNGIFNPGIKPLPKVIGAHGSPCRGPQLYLNGIVSAECDQKRSSLISLLLLSTDRRSWVTIQNSICP